MKMRPEPVREPRLKSFYQVLLILLALTVYQCKATRDLFDKFYRTLDDSLPCFRLTNANGQIGCSGSDTSTRGVLHYVEDEEGLEWLVQQSPHPSYIALMEPEMFTSINVPRLLDSSRVSGILLKYDFNTSRPADIEYFSAERECPNDGFGYSECGNNPWNIYTNGTSLSFSDFGDFPIFAIQNETFEAALKCYRDHNEGGSGGIADYPLCSAEMVADMLTVRNTESCYRRAKLLTNLVNGVRPCDPLGDKSVWGSLFNLTEQRISSGSIMLTTKLDSIAFFPYLSWGASNELAGVATLMAVLEVLGKLKKQGGLENTERPILFTFFHGESWDYIGSSRMVYDMERGSFPEDFSPKIDMESITDYLELTNLGISSVNESSIIYYHHNTTQSNLLDKLITLSQDRNIQILKSSRSDLPVASLQRFLRRNHSFSGAVLSDFDAFFENRFYGSRFDDEEVFSAGLGTVSDQLADLASLIAESVVNMSGPQWKDSATSPNFTAEPSTIEQILNCFLSDTNCSLFRGVLTHDKAGELEARPLQRYISVDTITNPETIITRALAAYFSGQFVDKDGNSSSTCQEISCDDCEDFDDDERQLTTFQMQSNESKTNCCCVQAYVHYHTAVSPAFKMKDYSSQEYSTWVESMWQHINLKLYLVTYPLQEVAFFFCGIAMMAITLLLAVQGSRKSDKIFNVETVPHSPLRLTAARPDITLDSASNPEPFPLQTLDARTAGTSGDSTGTGD